MLGASLQKSQFSEVPGTLRQGPWGPGEFETENFFKKFDGLHQMLPMTPFAVFKKSRFSEVSGTLRQGPWGPSEVETEFFFKISDPICHPLPRFKKVGFRRSRGPFSGVPGDPVRSKWKKNLKICNGLAQTLPMTPLLLHLNGINKNLEIPRPPQNFRKFSEIPGNIESPEDAVAVD